MPHRSTRTGITLRLSTASRVRRGILALLSSVFLAVALAACGESGKSTDVAGSADDFYKDKTITVVVPFGAGGGSDLAGRFFAEWLGKTLPGNPKSVVLNQEGGGGVVGWNRYAKSTKHDGLTMILGSSTPHSLAVYGSPEVEYDLKDFTPIVAGPTGNIMYTSPSSGVRSFKDLKNPGVQLDFPGIVPVGGDLYKVMPLLMLDVNVKETWGYESSGAAQIAFEQGEANVDVASGPNYIKDVLPKIAANAAFPLLATGQIDAKGDLVRDPLTPDLPTTGEVYKQLYGKPPSGDMWESYKIQTAMVNTLGRTLWIHGDAPQAAIDALTEAVAGWNDNADFKAANEKINGGYPVTTGAALDALVQKNLYEVPQANIDWLAKFVKEKYNVDLSEG
jgi:hypothetical protein